jgi:hypothetical protein
MSVWVMGEPVVLFRIDCTTPATVDTGESDTSDTAAVSPIGTLEVTNVQSTV